MTDAEDQMQARAQAAEIDVEDAQAELAEAHWRKNEAERQVAAVRYIIAKLRQTPDRVLTAGHVADTFKLAISPRVISLPSCEDRSSGE